MMIYNNYNLYEALKLFKEKLGRDKHLCYSFLIANDGLC